jgi:predicted dehydrogenase
MSDGTNDLSRRDFLSAVGAAALLGAAGAAEAPAAPKLESDRKVRIGVVGGGFGASFQWHLDPNCTVEAVSDLIRSRRERLQKVYKCEKAYESLEKLVLDPKIEAVGVFTGAPDHARHVLDCMKHGKHVISAVPACLTLDEAQALKAMKEKTGLRYMMAETSYYRASCILARELWKQGRFGDFLYSEVEYYHHNVQRVGAAQALWKGKPTPKGWRYGFPPMWYPTHSTAFHVGVTGERFTRVSCLGWGNDDPILKDNPYGNPFSNQVALFSASGGNMCRCNVLWWIHADGERAQWLGENCSVYMANSSGQPFIVRERGKKDVRQLPNYLNLLPEPMRVPSGHGGSHTFLTHEFVAALVGERPPAVDLYEALAMTVPGIVAMASSLKGGEQLKVPNFDKA